MERVLVLLTLAVAVVAVVLVVRALSRARTAHLRRDSSFSAWVTLGELPDGRPAVIQFSTRSCAACRTAQAPAVARVAEQLGPGAMRLVHVDASRQPAIASAFGVMTVPSTVVVAGDGRVLAVNQGFAPTARLLAQLRQAED